MRTKEEVIRRWGPQFLKLGMDALAAMRTFPRESTVSHADTVMNLPGQIEALIGKLYDDLATKTEVKKEGKP